MEEKKCYGCGAVIQTSDINKPGYVPEKALKQDHILCQRCFKMLHYHDHLESHLTIDDFLRILDEIGNRDCLVVYVVDLFDFNGSLVPGLMRHIGYNDVLVLGNKRDLLPKSLKEIKLNHWVRRQLKNEGIKPVDVIITSGKKNMNFDMIFDVIEEKRHGRDVYVIGTTNVGKSTFINSLLKHYSVQERFITTSELPGTTLGLIKIPLDEESSLYDTPGIVKESQMTSHVSDDILKKIIPQSEVKPMTFQLKQGQTLYFDGLARVDYLEGDVNSFTVYSSKSIKIHRCKTVKADELYDRHQQFIFYPEGVESTKDMKYIEMKAVGKKREVMISGLGFVTIAKEARVRVMVPKDVDVYMRECLI